MLDTIVKEAKAEMDKVLDALKKSLSTIRTGRASPNMLDNVRVDYYGTPTPLNQVASVSVGDSRMIIVKPFERKLLKEIERGIVEANLGFNPNNDGEVVRVPMPPLSTERRKEFVKLAKTRGEDSKVALRNVRRDANEALKESKKKSAITEDDEKRGLKLIQDATDGSVKKIDETVSTKEKEIMEI
jgi:ribosome recycling factor